MHRGVLFAAAATLIGAIVVFRYLPARGVEVDNTMPPRSDRPRPEPASHNGRVSRLVRRRLRQRVVPDALIHGLSRQSARREQISASVGHVRPRIW